MVGIFVSQEDRLGFVVYTGLFEVFESGIGVFPPEVFEAVDLVEGDLAGAELFLFAWGFDEPGEEGTVVDERGP